ncbi:unnamed protein product [Victoria cruziana]
MEKGPQAASMGTICRASSGSAQESRSSPFVAQVRKSPFQDQATAPPPKVKTKPEVDLLSSLHPAKSASEYPTSSRDPPPKVKLRSLVPFK